MLNAQRTWVLIENTTADDFICEMLKLGVPLETSLVGAFDTEGRGSRRNIDLPLHKDGDYSTAYKGKIDIVGLYCIKENNSAKTIIESNGTCNTFALKRNQALIFDNNICRHGRKGDVSGRVLLRVWVSRHSV